MSESLTSPISLLVRQLADKLLAKKLIISTAESCTGGWISQSLTALAGSSVWFDSGFVTYSNEAKQRLLNVPPALFSIDGPGAVSEAVVLAMTAGAIHGSRANLAVAVSGIAGPDGGTEEKPVGTVWIAWQWEDKSLARCFYFSGDRESVRHAAVLAALEGCLLLVD
ncbi:MAG: CinA family protein [Gammaproteobacteria bacterium]|nr:CinA family protein [Gammaproteobacteria bacterium]